jgi:hypothetical protein
MKSIIGKSLELMVAEAFDDWLAIGHLFLENQATIEGHALDMRRTLATLPWNQVELNEYLGLASNQPKFKRTPTVLASRAFQNGGTELVFIRFPPREYNSIEVLYQCLAGVAINSKKHPLRSVALDAGVHYLRLHRFIDCRKLLSFVDEPLHYRKPLSDEKRAEILSDMNNDRLSLRTLASRHGVSVETIRQIRLRCDACDFDEGSVSKRRCEACGVYITSRVCLACSLK